MKFFKPEDFIFSTHPEIKTDVWLQRTAAEIANAKLEREGKRVYYDITYDAWSIHESTKHKNGWMQAYLIGQETIKNCDHPSEKVRRIDHKEYGNAEYICECESKVEPVQFKAVE